MKKIVFGGHAEDNQHRKIAQKIIDERHVIRVVFEEYAEALKIITFYPARRKQYENKV